MKPQAINTLMAERINKIKIQSYLGDLIHDGLWIALKATPGASFYWAFNKISGGTYIGFTNDTAIGLEYLCRNDFTNVYRLTITSINAAGYPYGTIDTLYGESSPYELGGYYYQAADS